MHAKQHPLLRRSDFRLHPGAFPNTPHWLLTHPYGWTLLATELRKVRPDLDCPIYRSDFGFQWYLEEVITKLGLRAWQEPVGWIEHARASARLLRMFWSLNMSAAVDTAR